MSEEMTRKEVIDQLYRLKSHVPTFMPKIWHEKFIKALQFAIASLKTDEAYQLEYENRDCVEEQLDSISTTNNDLGVDWDELKRKILMEVDGSTDDAWLAYGEVCDRICNSIDEYIQNIKALSSVTPQEPRWIPVSEKLPNDRDWYLGIFKEPDTNWINPLPFICDYVGRETKATTKEHWILRGFTDWDDYHIDYYFNLECVAWMPLPQNYGEVEE